MDDLLKMLSDFVWDAETNTDEKGNTFTLAEWIQAQPRNWAYINHLFTVEGFKPTTFGWDDGKGRRVLLQFYPYVQTADLSSYGSSRPVWSEVVVEERWSYKRRFSRLDGYGATVEEVLDAVSAVIIEEGD